MEKSRESLVNDTNNSDFGRDKKMEDPQQLYAEFQMLVQQAQAMQQHFSKIDESLQELHNTNSSITELSNVKLGTEILVPLASGIFAKAKLDNNSEVLINTGASVVVVKSMTEAKEIIASQSTELATYRMQLESQMEDMQNRMREIQQKVENV